MGKVLLSILFGIVALGLFGYSGSAYAAGDIVVSVGSFDFGNVIVGNILELPLTISNSGPDDLTLQSLDTVGDSVFFAYGAFCGGIPATIPSGVTCNIEIDFLPTTPGLKTADLNIITDDPETPVVTVSLTGNAIAGSENTVVITQGFEPFIDIDVFDPDGISSVILLGATGGGFFDCSAPQTTFSFSSTVFFAFLIVEDCSNPTDLSIWEIFGADTPIQTLDSDGDGFPVVVSDPNNPLTSFLSDCDDGNDSINPSATDISGNDVDENCSGTVACYDDADSDGYGTTTSTESSFTATGGLADITGACGSNDGDSWDDTNDDCDDSIDSTNPGATEIVGDGVDNDCDGAESCYVDADDDGFGSSTIITSFDFSCLDPGESSNSNDCNDASDAINPLASEVCDNVDNDCDTLVDEGLVCSGLDADLTCSSTVFSQMSRTDPNEIGSSLGGYSCGVPFSPLDQDGPEDIYTFTCQQDGDVTVTIDSSSCDVDLYVLTDPSDPVNACVAGSTTPSITTESVLFDCTAGATYYIVVEGIGLPVSSDDDLFCAFGASYLMSFDAGAGTGCSEDCDNGIDDDGNGDVDCNDSLCSLDPVCEPTQQICGNGILESPEQCDDGNTASGDGCSAVCTLESLTCEEECLLERDTCRLSPDPFLCDEAFDACLSGCFPAVDCTDPGISNSNSAVCDGTPEGESCDAFRCDSGFEPSGVAPICQGGGIWGSVPICEVLMCEVPEITICHNDRTLTILADLIELHFGHDDELGACDDDGDDDDDDDDDDDRDNDDDDRDNDDDDDD